MHRRVRDHNALPVPQSSGSGRPIDIRRGHCGAPTAPLGSHLIAWKSRALRLGYFGGASIISDSTAGCRVAGRMRAFSSRLSSQGDATSRHAAAPPSDTPPYLLSSPQQPPYHGKYIYHCFIISSSFRCSPVNGINYATKWLIPVEAVYHHHDSPWSEQMNKSVVQCHDSKAFWKKHTCSKLGNTNADFIRLCLFAVYFAIMHAFWSFSKLCVCECVCWVIGLIRVTGWRFDQLWLVAEKTHVRALLATDWLEVGAFAQTVYGIGEIRQDFLYLTLSFYLFRMQIPGDWSKHTCVPNIKHAIFTEFLQCSVYAWPGESRLLIMTNIELWQ